MKALNIIRFLLNPEGLTVVLCSTWALILLFLNKAIEANKPSGPFSIPFLGYPFLGKKLYKTLHRWSKKYGNIFGFYLGSKYTVVLGDYPAIKEAYSKTAFLGRPPTSYSEIIPDGIGFTELSGEEWQEQRKVSMNFLKELGLGKDALEQQIKDEILELVEHVKNHEGKPCDIHSLLVSSISNNIVTLVFGQRLEYGSPKRNFLNNVVTIMSVYLQQTGIAYFLPWLKKILSFFGIGKYTQLSVLKDFNKMVNDEIETHRKKLDVDNPRDYIDHYLVEMAKRKGLEGKSFSVPRLRGNCQTLFSAGSDTIQLTINWALLAMATHPQIQSAVHAEIDRVMGREADINWPDHHRLPFTEAVIMEIQRWKTVVPLSVSRYTTEDTYVGGYKIPKHTIILPNIWACHNDPVYWANPELFDPERHLSKDKQKVIKQESYIPFSYGKRYCPGEQFATVQVFLYFTSLMQNFIVKCRDGLNLSDLEDDAAITLQIKPHTLRFLYRPKF